MCNISYLIDELQAIKKTVGDIDVISGSVEMDSEYLKITVSELNDTKIAVIHT